jgi:hypothetical protein
MKQMWSGWQLQVVDGETKYETRGSQAEHYAADHCVPQVPDHEGEQKTIPTWCALR